MIKRIIEVSQAKTYLSVKNSQLLIRRDDEQIGQIPCEDIGMLIVDHPGVIYTHCVFTELVKAGAAVVLCGADHHPAGVFMPVESNSVQTERMRGQLLAKEPIKKQMWKQLVQSKIRHQAEVLGKDCRAYEGLQEMANAVKSGDPENKEAQASKLYWKYFGDEMEFKRHRYGKSPNNMLNYGYAIVRAAVARAIVAAGLNPSIGVHHCNKYNAFCLADDLLEAFRGFVDRRVLEIWSELSGGEGEVELDQEIKAKLLEILYDEVELGQYSGPMMVGMHRMAASVVKCFAGESKNLDLPKIC